MTNLPRYPIPAACGVYILYDGSTVTYVGQSLNISKRIGNYMVSGERQFTHFSFILCPAEELNDSECETIFRLQPRDNQRIPRNQPYWSIPKAVKVFNWWFMGKITPDQLLGEMVKRGHTPRFIGGKEFFHIDEVCEVFPIPHPDYESEEDEE